MGEIEGIYTIWLREMKRFLRYRSRIVTSIVTPLLWLIIFGTGLGASIRFATVPGGYRAFIYPGIIGQTILFTSIFSGVSVIIDRQYGFLKEILVAPISRTSIVLGKAFGISTASMIQTTILLLLSFLVGIIMTPACFLVTLILSLIISMGFGGLGLMIAAFTDSMEGFNLIMSFIVLPIFLLSGALFPITGLPAWLKSAVYLNPLTYGVDAMRYTILRDSVFPLEVNVLVISAFAVMMVFLAAFMFNVKEQSLM
ncbi:MAG TPA: ABC transporter permease [Methanothermobacter sp.]|jgi:ABC-2 type transport system permease protein|uniref:Daunorubicin ABC transporter permease n=1 Tax=Methanothermobacter tenebrarum TaxID=680118 RepID=A0ABN6PAN7_9EURY|nr:ABC transporter permease [Methanothermobacter tenebrarum]MDD3454369.1 ABC transporter permease [Methanobacteriales archaeon]MDX9693787.1 ABC transporter permease [Methanothermobacter sp.]BDH78943.1 daunorubicin ABC transporter permease [Methanothermobacter tenebrarum]HHW17147.1 ABC transporter permease [Methanothermobacter sp.]